METVYLFKIIIITLYKPKDIENYKAKHTVYAEQTC